MSSTYLSRTPSSAGNRKTFTISMWVKRSSLGVLQKPFSAGSSGGAFGAVEFPTDDKPRLVGFDGSNITFDVTADLSARDTSGWYHMVWAVDTTQATANNRVKFYLNGTQITDLTTNTQPSQNADLDFNNNVGHNIGRGIYNGAEYFGGVISHLHMVDGTAYDASAFGSTDSTTGEWKINTSPSVTYGTNGFFILKDGNSVTDQSGNSNNFTVGGGTLTKTEDCPSNVFCTMNLLDNNIASSSFSNGNTTVQTNTSYYTWNTGTLGMTSGKFYWEVKYAANSNSSIYNLIGIADRPTDGNTDVLGRQTDCNNYGYYSDNGQSYANNTLASYGNAYGVGDIIGVAVDLDNSKIYWSKNGTWQNSGVPTSGSTGTGAVSIVAVSSTENGYYLPASGDYGSTQNCTNQHNFGNGYFGTTAVASAGSNASGNGIFEYDVPTGFTALSTKGLNL